ncbi:DNA-directed DNA polymerase II small subunit [Candidatus Woesearchaeota archaeon]|nr:DNA-directed DNA polymerase II small subunit [Candidatus Woesearchaeota archaeon]
MNQELLLMKREIVNYLLDRNILVSSEFLEKLTASQDQRKINNLISTIKSSDDVFILDSELNNPTLFGLLSDNEFSSYQKDSECSDVIENSTNVNNISNGDSKGIVQFKGNIKVLFSYNKPSKKRKVQDFVDYFCNRYKTIEKFLKQRSELQGVTSISRIKNKKDKEKVALIGIVSEKEFTRKNNNIILTIEDLTGSIKVLVNKNRPDLYEIAKDIVLDEIIGVVGANGENIVFSNNLLLPDIPLNLELKKSPEKGYAIFLSDLHVGSNMFLEDDFNKFLKWINCELGDDVQKNIARNVKYLFIAGDLIDGVGIYPGQEDELVIKDVYMQYERCAEFLSKIPKDIQIIICPGNHDAMRIAEPQLPLYKDFAKAIWELPNCILVSNPSLINIDASENFPGFNVLLYHGFSFDYFIANVDSIRNNGGYDKPELIMKFLMRRRHLAPTHKSTLYIPDSEIDSLVINPIPDFFVAGHIHKTSVSKYRNVTLICGSCWQGKTSFQEKVGHHPEPSRVPVVDLQTRAVRILKFGN